ncbi:MAG: helicase C-terminal domain-containing protein [Agitococcus sp.]|nr:helicase C-terminal domain-containing protein [Agitococcus sp.]MDO9177003.1 helicase C-terminal domain-containing protein [Agitococcus sp.]
MGRVIPILDAMRVSRDDTALIFIDECYEKLERLSDFKMRSGQKDLSKDICRALVAGDPIAAEAPTGTGKTLAYLIGAIAAVEKLRTTKEIPIVVATATVGLQSQILTGDLPRLFEAGILNPFDCVIAKGRSRYFCAANAERLLEGGDDSTQVDLFDANTNQARLEQQGVQELLESWKSKTWEGDSDSYNGKLPSIWPHVAANAETCLGHKCDYYNSGCPFFNARRALSSAKVIIANHDLVLSDLAMAKEGIDPLFTAGRYIVVFDEAHHLPDKALDIGAGHLAITTILSDLSKLVAYTRAWQKSPDLMRILEKQKVQISEFEPSFLVNSINAIKNELANVDVDPETYQARFIGGMLPPGLTIAISQALEHSSSLQKAIQDATQALKGSNLVEKSPHLKKPVSDLLVQSAFFGSKISNIVKTLTLLAGNQRAVRWAYRKETETSLHTSPLEGADVLRDLLWSSERVSVAMVSATLQDFDGFDRFKARCGAGDALRTVALPHIFPYRENTMYLVTMDHSPRADERAKFIEELAISMPKFINPLEGTLVLFPSRAMQEVVVSALRAKFGNLVMVQGDKGMKELISDHKTRIDGGGGNILCGLATMAEGLDLPGKLCSHVIICALPFSVPTSPVERELQELMGKEYFGKRALPDALTKLIQMVGRLMRRETDRGRITLFDKRIVYSKWGRKMNEALPAFRRKLVSPDCPPIFAGN